MLRALTANLITHERIETTDAKAKELRGVVERVITRAKRLGEVAYTPQDKLSKADGARRQAAQQQMGRFLRRFGVVEKDGETEKIDLIEKVFVDLAKRFAARPGGYTRIVKVGPRRGDNAPISIIEFVDYKPPVKAQPEPEADPETDAEGAGEEEAAAAS
jgi:large subunit ribosomal protein L17